MPIYSMNKVSSVGATHFVANENYVNEADLNRAMYESCINDQSIFEAILMADFNEVMAVREGTMVESEIQAMNEVSVKGILSAIKEKLKKAWEKIKSIFRAVYAKLSVWFVRNGKAFVAMHRNTLLKMSFDKNFKVPGYRMPKAALDKLSQEVDERAKAKDVYAGIDKINADRTENLEALATTMEDIRKKVTSADYMKSVMDACFDAEASVPIDQIKPKFTEMMENISTGGKRIRELKKKEREAEKEIRNAIKELDKAEKALDKTTDSGKDESKQIQFTRKAASTLEAVLKVTCSASIKLVRFSVNQDRRALGYCVGHGKMNENAMLLEDVAAEDDVAQLDDAMESPVVPDESEIPEEAKAIINIQVED